MMLSIIHELLRVYKCCYSVFKLFNYYLMCIIVHDHWIVTVCSLIAKREQVT
jgi:hypothetical protein